MVRIRKLVKTGIVTPGESLKDFRRRRPKDYEGLLRDVTRSAFDYVIPCFHTVHGRPITPAIFSFTGTEGRAGDEIELTHGGREFLVGHRRLIDYVAVSGWVRFSEAFTSAPRLHHEIGGSSTAEPTFTRHFAEWRSRDLTRHVMGLYDQAAADGFSRWQ